MSEYNAAAPQQWTPIHEGLEMKLVKFSEVEIGELCWEKIGTKRSGWFAMRKETIILSQYETSDGLPYGDTVFVDIDKLVKVNRKLRCLP